jgi:hypothetical protein
MPKRPERNLGEEASGLKIHDSSKGRGADMLSKENLSLSVIFL